MSAIETLLAVVFFRPLYCPLGYLKEIFSTTELLGFCQLNFCARTVPSGERLLEIRD